MVKKDNPFYLEGFRIGVRYGKVHRLNTKIQSDVFPDMGERELKELVLNTYSELDESLPLRWLEDGTVIVKKDWMFWLLGYNDGSIKYGRNKADKKYHDKIGLISKTYKLHANVVEDFSVACQKEGVSLSSTLEKLMKEFVSEVLSED